MNIVHIHNSIYISRYIARLIDKDICVYLYISMSVWKKREEPQVTKPQVPLVTFFLFSIFLHGSLLNNEICKSSS